ncbi:Nocturnin [Liparis tanakae]|uniref:Nocturnin n=1 Tax=Liparis tanakae TaxID=230148 RepID=A0A4Z2EDJ2_9TELE|nr:Nocturnin [Liparis tanakae]
MGSSSSSSSSSRLFGTLAQPDPDLGENPDQERVEPYQLLRECEEALQRRPARPHRDLVSASGTELCHHKLHPPIRIMQWNILAQGERQKPDRLL